MTIFPNSEFSSVNDIAAEIRRLIAHDATILFFVTGNSNQANLLAQLAEAQSGPTGIPGWEREVVWVKENTSALDRNILDDFLRPTPPPDTEGWFSVSSNDLGWAIGFGDRPTKPFAEADNLTATKVFWAFVEAEAQEENS